MPKRFKSDAFEAIHETMTGLRRVGAIDDAKMREFDAICAVPDNSSSAMPVFAVFRDAAGAWRWRLTDANGRSLAISAQGFVLRSACMEAIEKLRHLEAATVEER